MAIPATGRLLNIERLGELYRGAKIVPAASEQERLHLLAHAELGKPLARFWCIIQQAR